MVDMTAIGVVATSLNTAINIAKAMVDVRDAAAFQGKVFELQRAILEAQQSVFAANAERSALIEEIREAKAQIARLEAWEAEKQRYELKALAPGVFAYHVKEGMAGGEPVHDLCAACYQHGKKSILQRRDRAMEQMMICPECKTELKIGTARWSLTPAPAPA
jgi:hypothetical protein